MSYPAGFPGWKLFARVGVRLKIRVDVMRDDEAGVYIAKAHDLPGLIVEADTLEDLRHEVVSAAAGLLAYQFEQDHVPAPRAKTEIRMTDTVFCAA